MEHTYLVTICDANWHQLIHFVIRTQMEADAVQLRIRTIALDHGPKLFVEVEKVPELSDSLIKELVDQLGEPMQEPAMKLPLIEIVDGVSSTGEWASNALFPPDDAYLA